MSQNVLIQNEQVVGAGVSSASQISYDNSGTSLPNNVQGAISSLNVNLTNISSMVNLFKSSPIKQTGANTSVSFTVDISVGTTSSGVILGLCDYNSQCVIFAIPVHDRNMLVNNIVQIKNTGVSGVSATVSGNVLTINSSVYSYIQLLSPWTIA